MSSTVPTALREWALDLDLGTRVASMVVKGLAPRMQQAHCRPRCLPSNGADDALKA